MIVRYGWEARERIFHRGVRRDDCMEQYISVFMTAGARKFTRCQQDCLSWHQPGYHHVMVSIRLLASSQNSSYRYNGGLEQICWIFHQFDLIAGSAQCSHHRQKRRQQTSNLPTPSIKVHPLSTFPKGYSKSASLTSNQHCQQLQQHSFRRPSHHKACRRYRILNIPSFRITALNYLRNPLPP